MKFLPVQWFDSLPSTNTYLRERLAGAAGKSCGSGESVGSNGSVVSRAAAWAVGASGAEKSGVAAGAPSGTVVATREQTAGRGRFDRRWVSEPGRDLAFSFVVRTRAAVSRLPSLPMAAALGVAETLEALSLTPALKWPNDVLVGGRKISGILAEAVTLPARGDSIGDTYSQSNQRGEGRAAQPSAASERAVVVGIGVNVNMDADTAARIPKPATSVRIETGSTLPIETLLNEILIRLERWIGEWELGGFGALRGAWESRAAKLGALMAVEDHGRRIEGALAGYGDQGELLLRDAFGKLHAIGSGDATVLQNVDPTGGNQH